MISCHQGLTPGQPCSALARSMHAPQEQRTAWRREHYIFFLLYFTPILQLLLASNVSGSAWPSLTVVLSFFCFLCHSQTCSWYGFLQRVLDFSSWVPGWGPLQFSDGETLRCVACEGGSPAACTQFPRQPPSPCNHARQPSQGHIEAEVTEARRMTRDQKRPLLQGGEGMKEDVKQTNCRFPKVHGLTGRPGSTPIQHTGRSSKERSNVKWKSFSRREGADEEVSSKSGLFPGKVTPEGRVCSADRHQCRHSGHARWSGLRPTPRRGWNYQEISVAVWETRAAWLHLGPVISLN